MYTPNYQFDLNGSPESAVNAGLGTGQNILQNTVNQPQQYPDWWGGQAQGPKNYAYAPFVANQGLQQANIPGQYQGLMGGDYNRLETSLRQPGEIAANNAYQTGQRYLGDVMGGRGMYGSSVMGRQANEGLNREYQNTMTANAANAASQRYGLQQQGLQFGASHGLQRADLARQQYLDQWKAGLTDSTRQQEYGRNELGWNQAQDEAQRNFGNSQLQGEYQHGLARNAWQNNIDNMMMNRSLALAGQGAPLQQANMVDDRYYDQMDADQTAGIWQAALNPQTYQAIGDLWNTGSNIWDTVSGSNIWGNLWG